MGKIHWSVTASQDLETIANFIAQDSPSSAIKFVDELFVKIDHLIVFPKMGRKVPEFDSEKFHEIIFHGYRIVYTPFDEDIYIVSISSGSMDLVEKAKENGWILE